MTAYLNDELVNLRGMRREDLELYRGWIDNSEVTQFMEMGWKPFSDADLEATYQEATQASDTVCMVIEDRASGNAVGTCGLYLINWPGRRTQYRILIGEPEFFNKGLGTAAAKLIVKYGFERLNMETIYLGVNEENIAAIRSYEKAGFVREGLLRNFVYNNGKYYNSVSMSIIRDDYFSS